MWGGYLNLVGLTILDLFSKYYILDELRSTRLSDHKSTSDGKKGQLKMGPGRGENVGGEFYLLF